MDPKDPMGNVPQIPDPVHGSPLDVEQARRDESGPRKLTRKERRRRWWLLGLLLVLLALLAYSTYYYFQNRRLPLVGIEAPEVTEPPRYLYSITGTGKNELQIPLGVGVGPDGRVYVVDFGKRRVSVFTNAGRYLFAFKEISDGEELQNPVQITIQGEEVWVTDRRLRSIEIFDLEGEHLRTFEPVGEELDWSPLAVGFAADGGFVVTDVGNTEKHRVHYFTAEGSRTATFGRTFQANAPEEEPGSFFFPTGVAIAKDGSVYIADGNNRRVQVFDSAGAFKRFVDTSGVPRGIIIDAVERFYVVDAIAHAIDVYDLEGALITQFGGRGLGIGQFNYPNYIALDPKGKIFVSDRENDQVQVWGWPTLEPPAIVVPKSPWGWLACLAPLLLLPLLLLRKRRVVVTPEFMETLIDMEEIAHASEKRRLRLVAPVADRHLYAGRVVQDVDLEQLLSFEDYSEPDARAMADKYQLNEREAMLFTMAERAKALATQDIELRRLAAVADVRTVDAEEFLQIYLGIHDK
ncbi:MAG: NHL repeat-containing protein [Coriobacteriia bacterium]|nr:NHL repeat-containing protein [Coriobacteriia bacterium]